MLTKETIKKSFSLLNDELKKKKVKGEVLLCGGAVMCLVFNTRESTKDVDAIFEPTSELREAAKIVAKKLNLPSDWLNDGAKGFFSPKFEKNSVYTGTHLSVYSPQPEYILAMKCISARYDSQDSDDVRFLVELLEFNTPQEVFDIIELYYPKKQIPAKTQFFIEEILG